MAIGHQSFYQTQLTSAISDTDLIIPLDTVPTVSEGFLVIESTVEAKREIIYYTSKDASSVTCPSGAGNGRGYDGTTAVSHLQGATVIMAPVGAMFEKLGDIEVNSIDAGSVSVGGVNEEIIRSEYEFDFVASGGVWSGDAYASTRNASMTALVCYINGQRGTVAAVTARSFTASKDTYVDILNSAGTFSLVYTEVTNNAASPALAANSIRLAIIVTGASNIAAVGSVNQGQEDKVLPIASSIAYAVTDSLGNLICPRDPQRKLLGYKQIVANQGSVTSVTDVTGLAIPFIAPTGRKIKVTSYAQIGNATGSQTNFNQITEGATELQAGDVVNIATGTGNPVTLTLERILTPSAGLHTYKLRAANAGGTTTVVATSTAPTFIKVELA